MADDLESLLCRGFQEEIGSLLFELPQVPELCVFDATLELVKAVWGLCMSPGVMLTWLFCSLSESRFVSHRLGSRASSLHTHLLNRMDSVAFAVELKH